MTIPILDWGKRRGKVKVAESNRDVTLSKIRQEEISFNQDIFLLVENFNNQAAQLEIAQEADVIAREALQDFYRDIHDRKDQYSGPERCTTIEG